MAGAVAMSRQTESKWGVRVAGVLCFLTAAVPLGLIFAAPVMHQETSR